MILLGAGCVVSDPVPAFAAQDPARWGPAVTVGIASPTITRSINVRLDPLFIPLFHRLVDWTRAEPTAVRGVAPIRRSYRPQARRPMSLACPPADRPDDH